MILDRIEKDIKQAMLERRAEVLECLRSMKSALVAEKNKTGKDLTNEQEVQVLTTALKQRKEASEKYLEGGRQELADKENAESFVIEQYLPRLVTGNNLFEAVRTGIQILRETSKPINVGTIIKHVKETSAKYNTRVDGKELSEVVKAILA